MSRVGGGVFRRLLHEVADMRFDGRRLWWSRCQNLCVLLPDEQFEKWTCWLALSPA